MTLILGISGSLRKASYNTALLRAASALVPGGISIQIFGLNPLPLYNDDLAKDGIPAPVNDFRNSIKQSDRLLIASPENNYSLTGVLKNAIDWAVGKSISRETNRYYGRIPQHIWHHTGPTAPAADTARCERQRRPASRNCHSARTNCDR